MKKTWNNEHLYSVSVWNESIKIKKTSENSPVKMIPLLLGLESVSPGNPYSNLKKMKEDYINQIFLSRFLYMLVFLYVHTVFPQLTTLSTYSKIIIGQEAIDRGAA